MRRRAAALVLVLASAAFGGDEAGVRSLVEDALARHDRAAAIAILSAVIRPDAPRNRRRGVEAAHAAMDLVQGPEGNLLAAAILVDALSDDRSDREGAYSLAMGLRRRVRDLDLAAERELLTGLVRVYPETLDFEYDLARAYRHAGLVDLARERYVHIAAIAPSARDARLQLALLYEERGALADAVGVYDDLIAMHAQDAQPDLQAHMLKGYLLLWKAHDCPAAREALDAGLAAASASPPGPQREGEIAGFTALRGDIEGEEKHRRDLRELKRHLDRALTSVAAAWAIVLGGGLAILRRARWI